MREDDAGRGKKHPTVDWAAPAPADRKNHMGSKARFRHMFLVCLAAWSLSLSPGLASAGRYFALRPTMEVLEDPQGRLSIAHLASPSFSGQFIPNKADVLRFGLSRSVFWVRFRLNPEMMDRPAGEPMVLTVEKAMLESVRLFEVHQEVGPGGWREIRLAQGPLLEHPVVAWKAYAFDLPPDSPPEAFYVLRIYGPSLTLTIPVMLRTVTSFQPHQRDTGLMLGGLYGIILGMCLYNLFLLFSLRDRTYLYYVLWMLGAVIWLTAYNGHLSAYLALASHTMINIYYSSVGLSIVFALLFTKSFLNTREYTRVMDKVLDGIGLAALALVGLSLAGFHHACSTLGLLLARAGSPFIIVVAVICWWKGFKPARYLLLAWSISVAGIVGNSLAISGHLPFTTLTSSSWAIGTALESIFLAFALSDRIRTLQQERETLKKTGRELRELSITDELTRLYNPRHLARQLTELAAGRRKPDSVLSCIMLDVDHFKQINDTHGHPEGDKVLERLGKIIKGCIRDSDLGFRYGGEEFAVLLPGSGLEIARAVAERIRLSFAEQVFSLSSGAEVRATLSGGVAELAENEDPHDMVKRADEALYRAKRDGRNRTVAAGNI